MKYALVVLLLMFSITDAKAYRVVYYRHYHPYHHSYYQTVSVYTYPYYQPYRPYCLVQVLGLGICW
jgi:hypothetical protein